MQPTVEERSSVHLFIHSVIHFAAVHWLVSQYGKQGNHSAGARTATLLVHVPRLLVQVHLQSAGCWAVSQPAAGQSVGPVNIFNRRC